jgi:hypothetical protein
MGRGRRKEGQGRGRGGGGGEDKRGVRLLNRKQWSRTGGGTRAPEQAGPISTLGCRTFT